MYLKVSMPSQLWALYRFGVGTGRLSVCDFHAANTPRAARTIADMWSDACAVFCCCLHPAYSSAGRSSHMRTENVA